MWSFRLHRLTGHPLRGRHRARCQGADTGTWGPLPPSASRVLGTASELSGKAPPGQCPLPLCAGHSPLPTSTLPDATGLALPTHPSSGGPEGTSVTLRIIPCTSPREAEVPVGQRIPGIANCPLHTLHGMFLRVQPEPSGVAERPVPPQAPLSSDPTLPQACLVPFFLLG